MENRARELEALSIVYVWIDTYISLRAVNMLDPSWNHRHSASKRMGTVWKERESLRDSTIEK